MASSRSGYSQSDGIYRSLRPPIPFPSDPTLSMVPFLFRSLAAYPNRLALADADTGETITFLQLRSLVRSAAAGLSRLGVRKGDVVLLYAPTSLRYPVLFLSILSLGAIATTVNPLYTLPELSKQVKDSNCSLIVTVPSLWEKARHVRLPAVMLEQTPNHSLESELPITYFSDLIAAPESELSAPEIYQSDVAALLYSSGTTGQSKGVVLTHRNFICAALMAVADQERKREPPNTFLCFLPLFHIFGLSVITYAQLSRGNPVVLMGRFEMEGMLRAIERYRVSYVFVVPPVMIALAKQGRKGKYDLSSLKFIGSGAAPLGKDVMEEVAKNFAQTEVAQVYEFASVYPFNWT